MIARWLLRDLIRSKTKPVLKFLLLVNVVQDTLWKEIYVELKLNNRESIEVNVELLQDLFRIVLKPIEFRVIEQM